MNRENRIDWIDVLKGIGIVLVVLGHVYSNRIFFNWVYSFHMPLFFFASGLLYKPKDIKNFIIGKLQTVIIPYFTLGSLVFLYWFVIERKFRESSGGGWQTFAGLFYGQYDSLAFNVHLWFLPCFFLTLVAYNTFYNILGRKGTAILVLLFSVVFLINPLPPLAYGADWVLKYIAFFAVGHICSEVDILNKATALNKIMMATLCFGTNFIVSLCFSDMFGGWYIAAFIGIAGCIFTAILLEKCLVLKYLGHISIVVLCFHGPIYRVLVKIFSLIMHTSTDLVRENIFCALIVSFIAIGVSAAIYLPLNKLFPFCLGKKGVVLIRK